MNRLSFFLPSLRLPARALRAAAAIAALSSALAAQQLDENCVVAVQNRVAQVNHDGTWRVDNVPTNAGPVRARATCIRNGAAQSGESGLITVGLNSVVGIDASSVLNPAPPIPVKLTLTAPPTMLSAPNQTVQITVTGTYTGNSTKDLTNADSGTTYAVTNPALASIGADGLITARASGMVLVQANNEGRQGLLQISIAFSGDSDGDGIPDDVEIRLGLDPNNPADAMDDPDHDGLTNVAEFRAGTDIHNPDTDGDGLSDGQEVNVVHSNPLLKDTDGDGVPDNIEVATGSDPTDPTSFNLASALADIRVSPAAFTIGGSSGVASSQQLTVTGDFKLGGTIDLTAKSRGTTYSSSNLQACTFGAQDGRVFAGVAGVCTITATNSGFSATSRGTVNATGAFPISKVDLPAPGYANGVDVSGNFAFVANGSGGLVVVDASDTTAPQVVAQLAIPGVANDIHIVGNFAFIAASTAGLQVVDISNPLTPAIAGSVDVPGEAQETAIFGSKAYVAAGSGGLAIIDITNPANPALIKRVSTPGLARGVDMYQDQTNVYAIVADDLLDAFHTTSGLRVIQVTDPASAGIIGQLAFGFQPPTGPSVAVFDVRVVRSSALVTVRGTSGYQGIDLSDPAHPSFAFIEVGVQPPNQTKDIQFVGGAFSFVTFVANSVLNTAVEVNSPSTRIDFSVLDPGHPYSTTGIAPRSPLLFVTAVPQAADSALRGASVPAAGGTSRLYVGQFVPPSDTLGQPPEISLTTPVPGSSALANSTISIRSSEFDNIGVDTVTFQVNGTDVSTVTSQISDAGTLARIPPGATSVNLSARAKDFAGVQTTSNAVSITIVADPLTNIAGRVVVSGGTPAAGATVTCLNISATSGADGRFTITGFPVANGPVACSATLTSGGRVLRGSAPAMKLVAAGTTSIPDFAIADHANILLMSARPDSVTTQTYFKTLQSAGDQVTVQPTHGSFDASHLSSFDCVLQLNGTDPAFAFSDDSVNALTQFVRQGGGFIGFSPSTSENAQTSLHDLALHNSLDQGIAAGGIVFTVDPQQKNHPVLAGFPDTFTIFSRQGMLTDSTFFQFSEAQPLRLATVAGRSGQAENAISVRELQNGRIVRFAFDDDSVASSDVPDPNLLKLITNAATWGCRR